ncbi:hypothetical protein [Noviherbaspirillum sp.]|uniref:hypothetical protein n=1 Tax=Noviherbaspirillum sp. TaxID=1926288 RepID=UPI002FE35065
MNEIFFHLTYRMHSIQVVKNHANIQMDVIGFSRRHYVGRTVNCLKAISFNRFMNGIAKVHSLFNEVNIRFCAVIRYLEAGNNKALSG